MRKPAISRIQFSLYLPKASVTYSLNNMMAPYLGDDGMTCTEKSIDCDTENAVTVSKHHFKGIKDRKLVAPLIFNCELEL